MACQEADETAHRNFAGPLGKEAAARPDVISIAERIGRQTLRASGGQYGVPRL